MHAVVAKITIKDHAAAAAGLRDEVVPRVSGAAEFIAGYWIGLAGDHGTSVAVFESETAAHAAAGELVAPLSGPVTIDSVEVGEVVAHA